MYGTVHCQTQDRQVYCALLDPGQAGVLCTARTGRGIAHCQYRQVLCVPCNEWQVYGVLCTFRTGTCIAHCQDCSLSGQASVCALLGQAGVFCMVRTGRCILYGQDRQVYFVWSGQAGVFLYGQDRQVYFVWSGQAGVFCMVRTGRCIFVWSG